MNRILAICHSLSPEGLNGVNVFLRSLVQTFTMERFASIHILHGPAISRKDFPAEIPIHLHPMPETQVGPAFYFHLSDLPLYPDDFVMHVDIRDSYFQSFPFSSLEYSQTKLHVFAENSAKPVDQEPINLGWQNRLHANAIPDFLKGKPVVCFGVIGAGLGSFSIPSQGCFTAYAYEPEVLWDGSDHSYDYGSRKPRKLYSSYQ